MSERCECVVIGAGVVGLAVARALAREGREVIVLERHDAIGTETSSRNSEVIHAGIYYPTGSLKAEMCVKGKNLLYKHCKEYNVSHENIGKVIVATSEEQFDVLRNYQKQAQINGVGELDWLDKEQVQALE
ncbi:MAG: FAD-dependent oxidoreductase, partial [Gammaproteobacteria bacterium]|nr:FAD-dependent oxidoreductase [Gammaproteobacteria bacterium]